MSRSAPVFVALCFFAALAAPMACSSGQRLVESASRELDQAASECERDSRGHIGWLRAKHTDVTPRFRALLERVRAGEKVVPPEAGQYVWLLAPGLFSNLYPTYMDDNVDALRDLGLDHVELELTPKESVRAGAKVVRDAILANTSERQAVVLGHSKGGVDAAAALALYPGIRHRVRSFVAIQSPYAGSPVATDLANCRTMGNAAGLAVSILGNEPEAVLELGYERRRAFVAKHPFPRDVPVLSLATSRVDGRSLVYLTGRYVRARYGVDSDGLVVPADAAFPGSRVVRLDDMDHAESVMAGVPGFINYRPAELTQVLVAMALEL
ncbi:MAG: lipase [Myxococcota bacterium]|nr:lipase [Myxococcota bacterium]